MTKESSDPYEHYRKGQRAKSYPKTFGDLEIVICPTWEEKDRLGDKGVLPLHVDELVLLENSPSLSRADKKLLLELMVKVPEAKLVRVEEQQWKKK